MMFADRHDAGRRLSRLLTQLKGRERQIVLGLPRGGVPVACEVARALDAPFDIFVVRKLGLPANPELAMGAVASGGALVLNESVTRMHGIGQHEIARVVERERKRIVQIETILRGERPPIRLARMHVIIVDDGLATGATMRAAIAGLRRLNPATIIVATPVAPSDTCALIGQDADELFCVTTPARFHGVGQWYHHFDQLSDHQAAHILRSCRE